jgi:hypothetical protein
VTQPLAGFTQEMRAWDLSALTMTWGGFQISRGKGSSGYGPDVVVSVKQKEPDFKSTPGADGTVTMAATNQVLCEIELTVMQSNSPTNGFLSATRAAQKQTGVPIVLPWVMKDQNGTTVFSALKCVLLGPADAEYSADPKARTWKFEAMPEINFIGGN